MPKTSRQVLIVFALRIIWTCILRVILLTYVYIPPHAPGPGHAWRTTSCLCSSVIVPVKYAPIVAGIRPIRNTSYWRGKCHTIRLKGIANIYHFPFLEAHTWTVKMSHTRRDRSSINNDSRSIMSGSSHNTSGHFIWIKIWKQTISRRHDTLFLSHPGMEMLPS